MKEKFPLIIIINILLVVCFYVLCVLTYLGLGYYGGNEEHTIGSWLVFIFYLILQIGVNTFLLRRYQLLRLQYVIITYLEIIFLYSIVVCYYI